jgi:putative colanic acid biosynthesis glycosyltransferase WcaI
MRVHFFSTNYVPEKNGMAPFATGLCEHLAGKGHQVTAVTAFPYYPAWRVWDEYRGHLFQRKCINNVKVRRVWHFVPGRASNLLQRLAHDLSFTFSVLLAGLFAGGFNVICCVCPPPTLALTAYLLAKIHRKPYIIILTDLASDAAVATGILKDGLAVRLARAIEGFAYCKADRVVCICDGFVEKLRARGIVPERLKLIPLWGDTQNVYPIAGATEFRRANQFTEKQFLVMHTGNMGKKQDLMNVVRAAELSRDQDIVWLLVGHGEEQSVIEAEIRRRQLKNIILLPLQPAEGLAEMYSAADVLLLNQKAAVVDSVIPSKLLTYMAAGRAVLAAVSDRSETARYIERAKCGLIIHAEDPENLVEAALELRGDPAFREKLGANGRAYVQQHFTKEIVLQEYELLLSCYGDEVRPEVGSSKKAIAAS